MIKKIQLRGISRAPSDRMTKDGGCAESFNAQMEANETAPAPLPQDVTLDKTGRGSATIHYVHKLPSGDEILVGHSLNSGSGGYALAAFKDGSPVTVTNPPTVSSLADFKYACIGNILVVYVVGQYVQQTIHYYVYKDGGYTYLGDAIPKPQIEIITTPVSVTSDDDLTVKIARTGRVNEAPPYSLRMMGITELEDVSNLDHDLAAELWKNAAAEGDINHADWVSTIHAIWDEVAIKISQLRNQGIYYAPFFLRYALRLYDGSYIYISTPILCGGAYSGDWMAAGIGPYYRDIIAGSEEYLGFKIKVGLRNRFNVRIKGTFTAAGWADMIQSIDLFASSPIYAPSMNANIDHLVADDLSIVFDGMGADVRGTTIKNEVLSKGQYYRVATIGISDTQAMSEFASGTLALANDSVISGDNLYTQQELPDGYRDSSIYLPMNEASNYNGRVMLSGVRETLSRGDMFLNGLVADASSRKSYTLRYKIVDGTTGQAHYVMAHNRSGNTSIGAGFFASVNLLTNPYSRQYFDGESVSSGQEFSKGGQPYAWLAYPDSRCVAVEVFAGSNSSGKVIPLSAHPYLECAYAFLGMGVTLDDVLSSSSYETVTKSTAESITMQQPNKLLLSDFQNPFKFSAAGIISFSDEVIGTAQTSVPLSEGQYGQFPIYVFTGDGIRTLGVNSEGGISAKVAQPNLARYVALKGTILGLEQSVVFTTEKGVMLLRGGDVQCISEVMNGRHDALDSAFLSHINGWSGRSSLSALNDSLPFMAFMRVAVPAFDHNGARIIFSRENSNYHYVYCLNSGTWHKMAKPVNAPLLPLNSFPECLIASQEHVYNYSTILSDAQMISDTATPRNCLIVTRPLDFDEPDVRKSLNNIRIRGRYNRGDVQYVLMGSLDGNNWKILTSRHGGSYKWFRIAILATLAPTERISWIDVDFDMRMTNRLR